MQQWSPAQVQAQTQGQGWMATQQQAAAAAAWQPAFPAPQMPSGHTQPAQRPLMHFHPPSQQPQLAAAAHSHLHVAATSHQATASHAPTTAAPAPAPHAAQLATSVHAHAAPVQHMHGTPPYAGPSAPSPHWPQPGGSAPPAARTGAQMSKDGVAGNGAPQAQTRTPAPATGQNGLFAPAASHTQQHRHPQQPAAHMHAMAASVQPAQPSVPSTSSASSAAAPAAATHPSMPSHQHPRTQPLSQPNQPAGNTSAVAHTQQLQQQQQQQQQQQPLDFGQQWRPTQSHVAAVHASTPPPRQTASAQSAPLTALAAAPAAASTSPALATAAPTSGANATPYAALTGPAPSDATPTARIHAHTQMQQHSPRQFGQPTIPGMHAGQLQTVAPASSPHHRPAAAPFPHPGSLTQAPAVTGPQWSFNGPAKSPMAPSSSSVPSPSMTASAASTAAPASAPSASPAHAAASTSPSHVSGPPNGLRRSSISSWRKQRLLEKAHALYEQQHQHTRGLSEQLANMQEQLVHVHQQAQQHALAKLLPSAPVYSDDPDVSPLTSSMSASSDPLLLGLLENSFQLQSALCAKHALVEQMRVGMERMEAFVREQAEKEARREEEAEQERRRGRHPAAARPHRSRRSGADGSATPAAIAPLPDVSAVLTSPLVASLTAHISALQQQNSLTHALLLLKNKSLAQQQEQHAMLVDTLRAQISGLTALAERKEREGREERSMLTESLKGMVQSLALENEQLKQQLQPQRPGPKQTDGHPPTASPSHVSAPYTDAVTGTSNGIMHSTRTPPPPPSAPMPAAVAGPPPPLMPAPAPQRPLAFTPMSLPPLPPPAAVTSASAADASSRPLPMPMPMPLPVPMPVPVPVPVPTAAMPSGPLRPPPFVSPSAISATVPAGMDAATHALLSAPPFRARPSFLPPRGQAT